MPMPFQQRELTFTNPDGTEIQVRGSGDQFHAVFETLDGYTVTKDPATGFYQYARLSDGGDELLPTGVNVNGAVPAMTSGWNPVFTSPRRRQAGGACARRRRTAAPLGGTPRAEARPAPGGFAAQPRRGRPAACRDCGAYVGLCLLIEFPTSRPRSRRPRSTTSATSSATAASATTAPCATTSSRSPTAS